MPKRSKRAAPDSVDARVAELERQVRAGQRNVDLFLDHVPAAVAMLDRDLRYLAVSQRWRESYNVVDLDVLGLSHYDVFPTLPQRWRDILDRCLAGVSARCVEDYWERESGPEWLRWEVVPWRDAAGAVGGIIIFSEVITARKQAESALDAAREELERRVLERTQSLEAAKEEARRASERKSMFLAAASHDLRQPLQAATTYLAALTPMLKEEERNICQRAQDALDAASHVLSSLLDIAQIERGDIRPRLTEFAISTVFQRVLVQSQHEAAVKGVMLGARFASATVRSDIDLLERILANLVANAIRYTAKGSVEMSCEVGRSVARIAVKDTGAGISPDEQERIFEEFVQLGNPARDRRRGYGLGLAIVKRIAAALGAGIGVESEPGVGSTFWIAVPLASAVAKLSAPLIAGPPALRGRTVLLIEDDDLVAEAIMMLLRVEGLSVERAASVANTVRAVDAGLAPDIVISDYRLPDGDGWAAIAAVRQALGALPPVILMTGETGLDAAGAGLEDSLLLTKPVRAEELLAALAQAIDAE